MLRTGVVAEGVEDTYEVVQAGPVVWVTVQSLLEGVASQRDADESHGHLPNFIPHVDVGGVQHHGLREGRSRRREGRPLSTKHEGTSCQYEN